MGMLKPPLNAVCKTNLTFHSFCFFVPVKTSWKFHFSVHFAKKWHNLVCIQAGMDVNFLLFYMPAIFSVCSGDFPPLLCLVLLSPQKDCRLSQALKEEDEEEKEKKSTFSSENRSPVQRVAGACDDQ